VPSTTPKNHEARFAAWAILNSQKQPQPINISILGTDLQRDSLGKVKTVLFNFKDLNAPSGLEERTLVFDLYSEPDSSSARFNILEPYKNLEDKKNFVILGHLFKKPQDAAAYRINSYPNKISFSEIVQMSEKFSESQTQIKTLITEAITPNTQYNPDQFPPNAQPAAKYYTGITLRPQGTALFVDLYYCAPENCSKVQSVQPVNVGELNSGKAKEIIDGVAMDMGFPWLKSKLGL
jgi:hypothetical protein